MPKPRASAAWLGLGLALALVGVAHQAQALPDTDAAYWREDLRYMAAELPKVHKNLFHSMTRAQFDNAVRELDQRIPSLTREQVIVEMARVVAMVGDGHTQMGLAWDPKIGFHQYPLRLYDYSDGLYVRLAAPAYGEAAGARVVRIGKVSVAEAARLVETIIQRDNVMTVRDVLPSRLVMPEVLHALGIVDDVEHAPFVIEDRTGRQTTMLLAPAKNGAAIKWVRANDGAAAPLPFYLKHPGDNYWFEYLESARTLYVQFNAVQDKDQGESIAQFFTRVFAFADVNPVDKFVLDIRLNNGGDNTLIKPLIDGLVARGSINRSGHLFTIIGRLTFSAAQNLTNALEKNTNTLFAGEPTGARPNHYGETVNVALPNSGITLRVSTLWWQDTDANDTRAWTAPQIPAALSSEDYRTNNDPALNAILNYPAAK